MSASIARHQGASVACATKSHPCCKTATIVSDVLERLLRARPTGICPSSDQSNTIRETLAHTLRGLEIMGPAAAPS
jgi:hypothetical protein